jgi:predicted amidophosphoribosyltransferase
MPLRLRVSYILPFTEVRRPRLRLNGTMRFFCPRCWHDFERDEARCPHCGLDIEEFWNSKDYVEKLIAALHHPEKETPIRAAWLLGQLKDPRAVPPLIELVKETEDVYIARAAVQALGGRSTLRKLIDSCATSPSIMSRW